MLDVDITGEEKLYRDLHAIEERIVNQLVRKGLRAGAKVSLSSARQLVPEGKTKRLKKNLKVRSSKSRRKGIIRLGVGVGSKDFTGPTFYGAFVNFGHRIGKRRGSAAALARKVATRLRLEARAARGTAGGLAKKGTFERALQESRFAELGRKAGKEFKDDRKEVPAERFLEIALEDTRSRARGVVIDTIRSLFDEVVRGNSNAGES